MAYDEKLARRVRVLLAGRRDLTEKTMFGGLSFLLRGNMCCGVLQDELIVRVAPDDYPAAVEKLHARVFDFTGRPMKGWVVVAADGCRTRDTLAGWLDMGVRHAASLPPK